MLQETRALCDAQLQAPSVSDVARRLLAHHIDADTCHALARAVTHKRESVARLEDAREACRGRPDGAFERCVILQAARVMLNELGDTALPPPVKRRICEEVQWVARAPEASLARCRLGTSQFERLCKIATLRRFPAGLFEWELSGISRSDCLKTGVLAAPRVLAFVAWRMGGFSPVFFSHLNPHCIGKPMTEVEANRSYHRMALALRQQPNVLGFAACSWFRAPATHQVSPHLAWMSDVFRSNGGLVVDAGRDDPASGALYRSATRRALYESGQWVPKRGLVLWPRAAMLAWADRHPELGDG